MKTILCFGDSNTWGWDPVASAKSPRPLRHAPEVRWTGVLQRDLGAEYRIIEEGQSGRTTVHHDPIEGVRNGRDYLPPCLESHQPLDLVILMLGTNDLKTRFAVPACDIASGAAALLQIIQRSGAGLEGGAPRILLIAPPAVGDLSSLPELDEKFENATRKSLQFPAYFRNAAQAFGCAFLDSQTVVKPSPLDGLHLEANDHARLGRAVAEAVRSMDF